MSSLALISSTDQQRIAAWRELLMEAGFHAEVVGDLPRLASGLSRAPSLFLLDMDSLPGSGQEVKNQLASMDPQTGIIVLVAVPSAEDGIDWIRAGAKGYLNRLVNPTVFTAAVESVNRGEIWAGKLVVQQLLQGLYRQAAEQQQSARLVNLTVRERELAEAVADGLGNAQIAARMGISERTVKAHMSNIFSKLDITSRVQLALLVEQEKASPPANSGVA